MQKWVEEYKETRRDQVHRGGERRGEERRGGEKQSEGANSTHEHRSHHVRLYSETMKQAMRAISLSVTFSAVSMVFLLG